MYRQRFWYQNLLKNFLVEILSWWTEADKTNSLFFNFLWHAHLKAFFWKSLKKKPTVFMRTTIEGLRIPELRHKIIQLWSLVLSNNCSFIHTVSCPPTFCFWPHQTVGLFGDIRSDSWYFLCNSSVWAI